MKLTIKQRAEIHAVLDRLRAAGKLTPDKVISEAKKPSSPLHSQFTWNVAEAALLTWRAQARTLIASFSITETVDNKTYTIQEFVEGPSKTGRQQGYVGFSDVKSSKQLAKEFLDRELGIAKTYVAKTVNYARILKLEPKVAKIVKDLDALVTTVRSGSHVGLN